MNIQKPTTAVPAPALNFKSNRTSEDQMMDEILSDLNAFSGVTDEFGGSVSKLPAGPRTVASNNEIHFVKFTNPGFVEEFEDAIYNALQEKDKFDDLASIFAKIFFNDGVTDKEKLNLAQRIGIPAEKQDDFIQYLGETFSASRENKTNEFIGENPFADYEDYKAASKGAKLLSPEEFVKAKIENFQAVLSDGESTLLLENYMDSKESKLDDKFKDIIGLLKMSLPQAGEIDQNSLTEAARAIANGSNLDKVDEFLTKLEEQGLAYTDGLSDETKHEFVRHLDSLLNANRAKKSTAPKSKPGSPLESEVPTVEPEEIKSSFNKLPNTDTVDNWHDYLNGIKKHVTPFDANKVDQILRKLDGLEELTTNDLPALQRVVALADPSLTESELKQKAQGLVASLNQGMVKLKNDPTILDASSLPTEVKSAIKFKLETKDKIADIKRDLLNPKLRGSIGRAMLALAEPGAEVDLANDEIIDLVNLLKKNDINIDSSMTDAETLAALRATTSAINEEYSDDAVSGKFRSGLNSFKQKQGISSLMSTIAAGTNLFPVEQHTFIHDDMRRFFSGNELTGDDLAAQADAGKSRPLTFLERGKGDPAIQNALLESALSNDNRMFNVTKLLSGKYDIEEIAESMPRLLQQAHLNKMGVHGGLIDSSQSMINERAINVQAFDLVDHPVVEGMKVNKFSLDMGWHFLHDADAQHDFDVAPKMSSDNKVTGFKISKIPDSLMQTLKLTQGLDEVGVLELVNKEPLLAALSFSPDAKKHYTIAAKGGDEAKVKKALADMGKPTIVLDEAVLMKMIADGMSSMEAQYNKSAEVKGDYADLKARREQFISLLDVKTEAYSSIAAPSVYDAQKYEDELRAFLYNLELYMEHFDANIGGPRRSALEQQQKANQNLNNFGF